MKATSTDVNREMMRTALLAIMAHNNGVLNPEQVLEAARDPDHVLHAQFEWDDAVASEAYRLAQVGALVRRGRLTVERRSAATRTITLSTTRAYQSRPSMRRESGGYEAIDAILADREKRAELLDQVLRELSAYRKRYAELSELETVWLAVDDVSSERAADVSPLTPDGEARPGAAG